MTSNLENVISKSTSVDLTKKTLVGVSGGADSIVLAHLLFQAGANIAIAHCHFNLRGADADKDQEFCKGFAKQLGVPFFTTKFETHTYADTRKISIQMAARNLRYYWFEKICSENEYEQIAIGTHLTDNIETFLFNATKGTGLSGLRGIKPINGKIVRPLLSTAKEEIIEYATSKKWTWREDASNQSIKYHRNKIRHEVLPVLKEINPNLEATFQRNFKRLRRLDAFVQSKVDELWDSWVTKQGKEVKLKISDLQSNEFADVVLQYKLHPYGFNITNVENLLGALSSQPGSKIKSKDYVIYIDRTEVFIQPKRFFVAPNEYLITEFLGEVSTPIKLKFTDIHSKDLVINKSQAFAYFDFESLQFPLLLRKWKDGDKFHPFGMNGVKKVSDLLIDRKIPAHQKEDIWVMESDDEICWVVGLRSSETHRVSTSTNRVYSIELL